MKKKAFITGINGQDGSYLSNLLVEKGYKVYGLVRRNSINEHQTTRLDLLNSKVDLSYGDLLDESSLETKIRKIKPDEIYNLAAQSHVKVSFEIPQFTVKTNSVGVLNMLEAFRKFAPNGKFYQASSSEMFGVSVDKDKFQRETTELAPNSPYGCSKVFSFYLTKFYRRAYKLFVCNGILFNHESPFRGTNFVTNKIVKEALENKYIDDLSRYNQITPEKKYGLNTRFDFLLNDTKKNKKAFLEVKSVSLSRKKGYAEFPDAVTSRGKKHLESLISANKQGYDCYLLFLVQIENCQSFGIAADIDPEYSKFFKEAVKKNVKVLCYDCKFSNKSIEINNKIKILFND